MSHSLSELINSSSFTPLCAWSVHKLELFIFSFYLILRCNQVLQRAATVMEILTLENTQITPIPRVVHLCMKAVIQILGY